MISSTFASYVLWRDARSRHIWLFYCEPSEFDRHICGCAVELALGKGPLGEQRPVPVLESFLANLGNHLNRMKQRKACDYVLCDMVIRGNSV